MICGLAGKIVEKTSAAVAIDVSGVIYEVAVSLATYATLPAIGEVCRVYTHMSVREDGAYLYGFATVEEKRLFLQLVTVSGIGPKMAVKILGGVGPEQLMKAIVSADHAMLSTIPGIGKKTAERIVVELKDKFEGMEYVANIPSDVREDVIGALQNLGYKLPDCRKAVEKTTESDDFEVILKQALLVLAGKN